MTAQLFDKLFSWSRTRIGENGRVDYLVGIQEVGTWGMPDALIFKSRCVFETEACRALAIASGSIHDLE